LTSDAAAPRHLKVRRSGIDSWLSPTPASSVNGLGLDRQRLSIIASSGSAELPKARRASEVENPAAEQPEQQQSHRSRL
jgi:hypothetical protein